MKKRYFILAFCQLLFIGMSGILRRYSWREIDFQDEADILSAGMRFPCIFSLDGF